MDLSLAAFDRKSGRLEEWHVPLTNSLQIDGRAFVHALEVVGDKIYIGGEFDRAGGQPRAGLAAVDENGRLLDWNPRLEKYVVHTLAVGDEGQVYTGGWCILCGPDDPNGVVVIAPDGSARHLGARLGGEAVELHALALGGSRLFVGGQFDQIGSASRPGVAAIDAGTGELTPWVRPVDSVRTGG